METVTQMRVAGEIEMLDGRRIPFRLDPNKGLVGLAGTRPLRYMGIKCALETAPDDRVLQFWDKRGRTLKFTAAALRRAWAGAREAA